jgi:hypothetical protein
LSHIFFIGLADGVADDIADATVHRGPDLVVRGECEADARQTRQRHQGGQCHAGRRQQFDTAGAKLRQHLRIAPELTVGENRDVQPARRLRADRVRRLDQSKREGMGVRRIDAKLELEFGGGAGGVAEDGGCPSGGSGPEQIPAGYFHFLVSRVSCLPSAFGLRLQAVSVEPPSSARCLDKVRPAMPPATAPASACHRDVR